MQPLMAADVSPLSRLLLTEGRALSRADNNDPYIPMMLKVSDSDVGEKLSGMGVMVYNGRGDMLLVSVPREAADDVISMPGVEYVSMSGDMSRCLDKARIMTNVDMVHSPAEYPPDVTGKGVVVGIADVGFDARHIAFSENLVALYDYDTSNARRTVAAAPSEIAVWTTDRPDECHATHVAGILAGGYRGNSYYGVAPGASLVVSTSDLSDVGLLAGVEDIIAYGKSQGKPVVVNMSVSNSLGPHDGTDLLCRYLSLLAREATICISAGNSGRETNFATQVLSGENPEAGVMFNTFRTRDGFAVDGICDVWCQDSSPFQYSLCVYDLDERGIVASTGWLTTDAEINLGTVSGASGCFLEGTVRIAAGESTLNGRYNMTMQYDYTSPALSSKGHWARYYLVLKVRAETGKRIDFYSDGIYSYMGRISGLPTYVGPDGSINDMCTADGVVAVGACCSDNVVHTISDGDVVDNGFKVNNVAPFSSYSDVPSIRRLPHICAPGAYIVSALSSPFAAAHPEKEPPAFIERVGENDYRWRSMCGTSMAAPHVAGVFALWLEVAPWLTTADLIELACETARRDFDDIDNPRWGAGCIDAAAGLSKLSTASSGNIMHVHPDVVVTSDRRVMIPDGSAFTIHDLQGRILDPGSVLSPGIYIINVSNGMISKILIK